MKNNINKKLLEELSYKSRKDGIEKVVAGAVIFFKDNKILLLERLPNEFKGGLVELPSGNIEADESIINGLKREVKEETDLDVLKVEKYVGFFDYFSSSGKKVRQFNFVSSVSFGKVKINPLEHTRFFCVDPLGKEFKLLNISLETKEAIKKSL